MITINGLTAAGAFDCTLDGHRIEVPANERGVAVLRRILMNRKPGRNRIAEPGSPTQHLVEQWLKDGNRVQRPRVAELVQEGEF